MISKSPLIPELLNIKFANMDKGLDNINDKFSEYPIQGNYPNQNEKLHFDNDPYHEVQIRNKKYNKDEFENFIDGKSTLRTHLIRLTILHKRMKEVFINFIDTIHLTEEYEGKYKIQSPTYHLSDFEMYYDFFMLIKDDILKNHYKMYWDILIKNVKEDLTKNLHTSDLGIRLNRNATHAILLELDRIQKEVF